MLQRGGQLQQLVEACRGDWPDARLAMPLLRDIETVQGKNKTSSKAELSNCSSRLASPWSRPALSSSRRACVARRTAVLVRGGIDAALVACPIGRAAAVRRRFWQLRPGGCAVARHGSSPGHVEPPAGIPASVHPDRPCARDKQAAPWTG